MVEQRADSFCLLASVLFPILEVRLSRGISTAVFFAGTRPRFPRATSFALANY